MQPDVSWEEVDTRHTSRSCSDLRISGVTPPMVKRSFKFVGVGERDWVGSSQNIGPDILMSQKTLDILRIG